jgi:hypothetical protein
MNNKRKRKKNESLMVMTPGPGLGRKQGPGDRENILDKLLPVVNTFLQIVAHRQHTLNIH